MNTETRKTLQQAFAEDDLAIADFARHEQSTPKTTRHGANAALVRKDFRRSEPKAAAMNEATAAAWDAWASRIIQSKLEVFADIIGEETARWERKQFDAFAAVVCEETNKVRDMLGGEIHQLRRELLQLRGEVATIKTLQGSK